jgi:hypothetical protein
MILKLSLISGKREGDTRLVFYYVIYFGFHPLAVEIFNFCDKLQHFEGCTFFHPTYWDLVD